MAINNQLQQLGYYDAQRDQYLHEQAYRNKIMEEQFNQMNAYRQRGLAQADQSSNPPQVSENSKPNLLLLIED